MLIEDQPKNPTPAPPPSSDFGWTNTESSHQPFSFPSRPFTPDNTRLQTTPSTIMKFTFTSTTMPCAMVLVVALLPGNSASLKPVGGSKNATAGANGMMMLSNATMMDPNMTAADELSNKKKMKKLKKLGSGSVSVSTVVGAPARADPLSLFAYFMLCFCGVANIIAHTPHSHHTSALCPPSHSADERRR